MASVISVFQSADFLFFSKYREMCRLLSVAIDAVQTDADAADRDYAENGCFPSNKHFCI